MWCTLGILGYQRPFIHGYMQLARPLTKLTKKGVPFCWKQRHTEVLDTLIRKVTTAPMLRCPKKQYFLEVDTLAFTLGAVLFQKDKVRKRCNVAYFLKALMPPEQNYNVWNREFLAVVAALQNWRHLLIGTQEPVLILMDHTNLQYYRHPQKINRRIARYINFLEDFNYQLKHIPGICNHADTLLRRPDYDDSAEDNKQVVALPDSVFI